MCVQGLFVINIKLVNCVMVTIVAIQQHYFLNISSRKCGWSSCYPASLWKIRCTYNLMTLSFYRAFFRFTTSYVLTVVRT